MTTYPADIPALAPLASGVDDSPAQGISQGQDTQDNHVVAATKQHDNRKRLFQCVPPLATPDELVASKRRKYHVESANFGTPHWVQMLQQQIDSLQQQIDTLRRESQRESQRSINRSRKSTAAPIEMLVRVEDGQMPNQQVPALWFPENQQELLTVATQDQVSALLQIYGEPVDGTLAQQTTRLEQFLGVTL